uniref:C-type lectin domain-containing protein n=1 Tax=Chrysemys picta bellii TaxID=8478 RepID=A0A8C3HV46_CHRPI
MAKAPPPPCGDPDPQATAPNGNLYHHPQQTLYGPHGLGSDPSKHSTGLRYPRPVLSLAPSPTLFWPPGAPAPNNLPPHCSLDTMDCLGSGLRLAPGRANWCLSHPSSDEGAPEQEVSAEQGEEEPREPEPPCPTDSESFRVIVPGQGGCFARYVVVNNCQTFWNAQNVCARCYRGRLASIHGSVINRHLSCMARAHTNRAQVWIGGITSGRNHCLHAHWVDRSSWNYSNWARGNPCRTGCPGGLHGTRGHCVGDHCLRHSSFPVSPPVPLVMVVMNGYENQYPSKRKKFRLFPKDQTTDPGQYTDQILPTNHAVANPFESKI